MLIGGKGTRLRPFSCGMPKPLLPVVNRPFVELQFDLLRRSGIKEVILCTAYRPGDFRRTLGHGRVRGLKVRFVHERVPLETGGALKNAQPFADSTLLVLNGDVFNPLDVGKFVRAHRQARADVSIALTRVKDPTRFGLVETNGDGRVVRFLEKPSWDEITCNTINAGAYLFEPKVLDRIPPGVPFSLERGLFPALLQAGRRLQGFVTQGYWIDMGTVDNYLQVHLDILSGRVAAPLKGYARRGWLLRGAGANLAPDVSHEGAGRVVVGAKSSVGPFVRFAGSASIGAGCRIGRGAVLEDCVLLDGVAVGEGARLTRCVVGRRCRIGANAVVSAGRALGDGTVVAPFSQA